MSRRITRRQALAASAAGLGYFYTAPSFAAAKIAGANGKLCVVGIGVGGKGGSDIDNAGNLMEVVALCDVDSSAKHLGAKAKKWPQAKTFDDYRKLFDDREVVKTMDAATISTPDHNHALAASLAIRNKKHVYVQKPLTHTVFEAHHLKKLARQHGVCTQMGNQGTASNGLRRGVELVQAGTIGPVKEVHVWTNRPIWPQAPAVMQRLAPQEVPPTVNWDAFIGPSPERPYNKDYHPFKWRGWWDFGTGAIGDMACHTANMAFMALKLGSPTRVSAEAGDVNPETCPSYAHVVLEFPARGDLPPVTLHWYEGKKDGQKLTPPQELLGKVLKPGEKLANSGSLLVGEKGLLFSPDDYGSAFRITPGTLAEGMNTTKPERLPTNGKGDQGQKDEWVQAIQANKPEMALSNFDYSAMLTAAFLLGNVAIRTGKPFEFDAETCSAKDNPAANALIKTEYRKGWDMLEKA